MLQQPPYLQTQLFNISNYERKPNPVGGNSQKTIAGVRRLASAVLGVLKLVVAKRLDKRTLLSGAEIPLCGASAVSPLRGFCGVAEETSHQQAGALRFFFRSAEACLRAFRSAEACRSEASGRADAPVWGGDPAPRGFCGVVSAGLLLRCQTKLRTSKLVHSNPAPVRASWPLPPPRRWSWSCRPCRRF
jgi:hypothetical protein